MPWQEQDRDLLASLCLYASDPGASYLLPASVKLGQANLSACKLGNISGSSQFFVVLYL